MLCKYCGAVVDGLAFCPQCGTPVDIQFDNENQVQSDVNNVQANVANDQIPQDYVQGGAPYEQPVPEYQQNNASYAQPIPEYQQNNVPYGQPAPEYQQNNVSYAQPVPEYQQNNASYAQPVPEYQQNNVPYGQPAPGYQQNNTPYVPPMTGYQQNYSQYNQYANGNIQGSTFFMPKPNAGEYVSVLVFGILALSLSFVYGIGLIFAIIGLAKSSNFVSRYGDISTQVKVGRGLSIAGLVISIIVLVLIFFIICTACTYYN